MKSYVEHYVTFDEILLPEPYRVVEIPSWEAVVEPVMNGVLNVYNEQFNQQATALTDEMVAALQNPNLTTLHELRQFAMEAFQEREREMKFQHHIFPYLLVFFANTTQTVINSEESDAYYQAMMENYREEAEKLGWTLDEFIRDSFQLEPNQKEELQERIHEYFVFKLIAYARFGENHGELDEASYDAFIQQQVVHQMVDEIDLRERLPYVVYKDIFPEILLTEELKDYFKPQISFQIQSQQ
ncbi:hypothetical protein [Tuanshanicoccus lijuaniae]|uniref:hypothetical protein n=1 Tax=Aerococcaceae bacterium zg-1292 TaxID=2774330 RepID=UPI001BD8F14B|nr:hypothetical protein [Aerococcaceae bacterium zg-BR22]MBS4455331.1 hypothetical protein [Aerococcaceae bacterium zg-A91]MBS4457291.1 hypothetical protein [Aerococcaceae bacterium zg-BR33]